MSETWLGLYRELEEIGDILYSPIGVPIFPHEKNSTLITSNKRLANWQELFGDTVIAPVAKSCRAKRRIFWQSDVSFLIRVAT
jgi:nitrogenase molybdenum-iron protein alpha/beta subunit